jgi:hypothetical protein
MNVQTYIPDTDDERDALRSGLDDLEAGDSLDGKTITHITHIEGDGVQAPGAVVTRVWRESVNGTEYATHLLNKQTGGCAYGDYTRDAEQAASNHEEKVKKWS